MHYNLLLLKSIIESISYSIIFDETQNNFRIYLKSALNEIFNSEDHVFCYLET